jgi:6-pyruvoyltetrahydropterin/6-carboxytetrahydropterin synthase
MYRIERRFTAPIGHRLSKHKGRCKNIHGHNFTILVGIKSENLNENDMVMDFTELKEIVGQYIDMFDHCLLLNKDDKSLAPYLRSTVCERVIEFPFDPTAERLSEQIYNYVEAELRKSGRQIFVDYVTVYENENSKATFDRSH